MGILLFLHLFRSPLSTSLLSALRSLLTAHIQVSSNSNGPRPTGHGQNVHKNISPHIYHKNSNTKTIYKNILKINNHYNKTRRNHKHKIYKSPLKIKQRQTINHTPIKYQQLSLKINHKHKTKNTHNNTQPTPITQNTSNHIQNPIFIQNIEKT